jgi:16S rRNA G527 N7-methylase RsmG
MEQTLERLTEKMHTLTDAQLAEVERFVESLQAWERDRELAHAVSALSAPGLAAVWSNPEDDVYDDI